MNACHLLLIKCLVSDTFPILLFHHSIPQIYDHSLCNFFKCNMILRTHISDWQVFFTSIMSISKTQEIRMEQRDIFSQVYTFCLD
jgi:chromatin segregation and condensation protein Rec8/ScpA/Scc1 (kleisin family)